MDITCLISNITSLLGNLKAAAITGIILWFLIAATLQVLGLVDIRARRSWCIDLLPKFISQASGATASPIAASSRFQPILVEITLLPGLSLR
jgi:hypothetical protein